MPPHIYVTRYSGILTHLFIVTSSNLHQHTCQYKTIGHYQTLPGNCAAFRGRLSRGGGGGEDGGGLKSEPTVAPRRSIILFIHHLLSLAPTYQYFLSSDVTVLPRLRFYHPFTPTAPSTFTDSVTFLPHL